jgi:hypothetical protein
MSQQPWSAESLGDDRYRFTNTSGGKLGMIVLLADGSTEVAVEGAKIDPDTVDAPVDAGDSFIASVKGRGVQINATAVPAMANVIWKFTTS